MKQSNGTTTTIYPNKLYNTDGTTETKHIFDAEGNTIATIETESATSTTFYTHTDHLTGFNVVTNEEGALEQTLDYFPFGGIRLNSTAGTFDEQRKFTGHEYDTDTGLSYMVARYYDGSVGRFTAQDPVFLAIGTDELQQKTNQPLSEYFSNPQNLNSYSYTINNPLKYVDEEGEIFETFVDVGFVAQDIQNITAGLIVGTYGLVTGDEQLRQQGLDAAQSSAVDLFVDTAATAVPFLPAGLTRVDNATQATRKLPDSALACRGGSCKADNFLKGSNEFKTGLNPSADTSLTGISVNVGDDATVLLNAGPLSSYGQYGQTTVKQIKELGGTVTSVPTNTNPAHATINGLNANQLENLFTPTKKKSKGKFFGNQIGD